MTAFVMPEDAWLKLCARQCKARQKLYGEDEGYCAQHNGLCPECVADASERVPKKYRTTPERAAEFDSLPGCRSAS